MVKNDVKFLRSEHRNFLKYVHFSLMHESLNSYNLKMVKHKVHLPDYLNYSNLFVTVLSCQVFIFQPSKEYGHKFLATF